MKTNPCHMGHFFGVPIHHLSPSSATYYCHTSETARRIASVTSLFVQFCGDIVALGRWRRKYFSRMDGGPLSCFKNLWQTSFDPEKHWHFAATVAVSHTVLPMRLSLYRNIWESLDGRVSFFEGKPGLCLSRDGFLTFVLNGSLFLGYANFGWD